MASKSKSSDRSPLKTGSNDGKSKSVGSILPKDRLAELVSLVVNTAEVKGWYARVDAQDTTTFHYATVSVWRQTTDQRVSGTFEVLCDKRVRITYHGTSFHSWGLSDLYDAISNEFYKLSWIEKKDSKEPTALAEIAIIERLLRRFHRTARQLRHRYNDRPGVEIKDEYDIQDLLHAMLRGLFDDVRSEEHTPSYAGGSSRMDFLLKNEKIVIEVKLASATLRDKQIGEQLLIDIGRYRSHPDCQRLICFVYDPSGHLKNPSGLESDLSKTIDDFTVKVIVVSV